MRRPCSPTRYPPSSLPRRGGGWLLPRWVGPRCNAGRGLADGSPPWYLSRECTPHRPPQRHRAPVGRPQPPLAGRPTLPGPCQGHHPRGACCTPHLPNTPRPHDRLWEGNLCRGEARPLHPPLRSPTLPLPALPTRRVSGRGRQGSPTPRQDLAFVGSRAPPQGSACRSCLAPRSVLPQAPRLPGPDPPSHRRSPLSLRPHPP